MIVETKGAITTKPMQQKIHHLRRFGFSAGVFAVLAVENLVSKSMESEVGIIQFEKRGRSVKHYKENMLDI